MGTIQNKRGKTPNDSNPKKSEPLTNNTKEKSNKREEGRSLGSTPPPPPFPPNPLYSKNVANNIGKKILHINQRLLPSKKYAL